MKLAGPAAGALLVGLALVACGERVKTNVATPIGTSASSTGPMDASSNTPLIPLGSSESTPEPQEAAAYSITRTNVSSLGQSPTAAYANGRIWLSSGSGALSGQGGIDGVVSIDPASGEVVDRITIVDSSGVACCHDLVAAGSTLWGIGFGLWRIDTISSTAVRVNTPPWQGAIVSAAGHLYTLSVGSHPPVMNVAIFNETTGVLEGTAVLTDAPWGLVEGAVSTPGGVWLKVDGIVWFVDQGGAVTKLEPEAGGVYGDGYKTAPLVGDVLKVSILDSSRIYSIDPATGVAEQVPYATGYSELRAHTELAEGATQYISPTEVWSCKSDEASRTLRVTRLDPTSGAFAVTLVPLESNRSKDYCAIVLADHELWCVVDDGGTWLLVRIEL